MQVRGLKLCFFLIRCTLLDCDRRPTAWEDVKSVPGCSRMFQNVPEEVFVKLNKVNMTALIKLSGGNDENLL